MTTEPQLPDPAVVVLVGASGSGKSTWAASRYRTTEIVSSDGLRAVLGSGPADMEASVEAFELLDRIVAARSGRRLTTVIDTTGLETARRLGYLAQARAAGLPAVTVVLDTDPATCRQRNAARDRSVPAPVLAAQFRRVREVDLVAEGWDVVHRVSVTADPVQNPEVLDRSVPEPARRRRLSVMLQVSRFPWQDREGPWLRDLAIAADAIGFDGIALMDHLIQIPQVGRAWDPIPEPWVSLGFLAGLNTDLRLGTLVSPVTFRAPGIIAKMGATLDVLSGGRAFCGLGAGWWAREHAAYGLDFPPVGRRLDRLEACIETLRALWSPGTKAYAGQYVTLPETTGYPRPVGSIPIIVGGSGEQRTLRIAAERADGCNLPSDQHRLLHKIDVLRRHCTTAGRDPDEVEVTVLDLPVLGVDREDVATRVERLRGRTSAASFAAQHHAGVAADHARRYRELSSLGVGTVFMSLPDLRDADDLARCRPLLDALD